MTAQLTTHALDTIIGAGAAGLKVGLARVTPDPCPLGEVILDEGGRGALAQTIVAGVYELTFHVAAYHRGLGVALADPPFLDEVTIRFGVADPSQHHHVPLLLTPYSYSTYRGG